ncbi:hypothetical protein LCGC14_2840130 [marine sediment metagenome]|uniref:Uncharacterized protein n=1 Tax=marine sediment metagenome TaxID=412755 RepID=A0A0F8YY34_9ZZZZ
MKPVIIHSLWNKKGSLIAKSTSKGKLITKKKQMIAEFDEFNAILAKVQEAVWDANEAIKHKGLNSLMNQEKLEVSLPTIEQINEGGKPRYHNSYIDYIFKFETETIR